MARKAPPRGQAKRKASSAPKRKAAAAPKQLTAYQKRLRDYQRKHPGWRSDPHWKQKARGHKIAEHVIRAQRFRDRMDAFIMQQVARWPGVDAPKLAAEIGRDLWAQIKLHGEGRLRDIQRLVARMERERAEAPKDERGRPQRLPWVNMETLEDEWQLPREIFGYH